MIIGILQARMSSSRLPGKVLKPILGAPMLLRQIERLNRIKMINELIVATSVDCTDDPIEECCNNNHIFCYRGSLEDVLDRYYQAAVLFNPDHVVRLTGDCPLADPELIDSIIKMHLEGDYDYTSNTIEQTFPDGLDAEVIRFSSLKRAWVEAELPSEREHVTPFIHKNPQIFKIGCFKNPVNYSALRWTVDEELDYELIVQIYKKLYPSNPHFNTQDVLALLEQYPDLKTYNVQYERNEGYKKSLIKDHEYLMKREGIK